MEALGISISGLVTQIISFLILFGLLYVLLYKPILRMLDERSGKIRDSLETAQKAREDADRSQKEMSSQIEAARAEGQSMIAQAREVADRFREEELTKARAEIEEERIRAQTNIHRERDAAIEELRREFSGLAITAAERVLEHSLDESIHHELIDKVLEEGLKSTEGY